MIGRARLEELVAKFAGLSIGLVGDLFLDRYLHIDPRFHELSVETGLEAYQVTRVCNSPGALGTVVNNLVALGVKQCLPVSVVGDDGEAHDVLAALERLGTSTRYIIKDRERLTPTYTKPLGTNPADGTLRELNRLDQRNARPPSAATTAQLLAHLDEVSERIQGLIVADQVREEDWGVVTGVVRQHLAELAHRRPGFLVCVDSRARIGMFRGATLKPNLSECRAAVPSAGVAADDPEMAVRALAEQTGCRVFCTMGESGILIAHPSGAVKRVPTWPVTGPVDIVGAGDSATAGIVTALLAGANEEEAATIGNLVASVTVQKLGTTGTCTPAELCARHRQVVAD